MEINGKQLLIIFYRNPEPGRVKTRLASTIGNDNALKVYTALCQHTKQITEKLDFSKVVFYSEHIQPDDIWPDVTYEKRVQSGADLGTRMHNAFQWGFENGHDFICIIGTDCYELTSGIVESAFSALRSNEVVIGPALDGGYYLLGMRRLRGNLFVGKQWSTKTVFADTIKDLISDGTTYAELPTLRDVDVEDDISEELRRNLRARHN